MSLFESERLPLEACADALAGTLQRAFEPPEQLPDAVLPLVAAQLLSRLDRLCATVGVRSAAAMAGVSERTIMLHTGHKNIALLRFALSRH